MKRLLIQTCTTFYNEAFLRLPHTCLLLFYRDVRCMFICRQSHCYFWCWWHCDQLTLLLPFFLSSASITRGVIPIPIHCAISVSQVLFDLLPHLAPSPISCASAPSLLVAWPDHWSFLRHATSFEKRLIIAN